MLDIKDLYATSLESHSQEPVVTSAYTGVFSLESDMMEVMETEQEMAKMEESIEGLEEIACGMESLMETIHVSLENGGLTAGEAVLANSAVSAYTNRLGVESVVASTESFGGESERLEATKVSLEAMKETFAKIWMAIKNAVAKVMKMVADFFAKIFGSTKKVEDRIMTLQKMVSELKDDEAPEMIKMTGASTLHMGGKVDPDSVMKGIDNTMKALSFGLDTIASAGASYYGALAMSLTKDEADLEEILKSYVESVAKASEVPACSGDKGFMADAEKGVVFGSIEGAAKVDEGMEVKPMSKADLKKVLEMLKEINSLIDSKKGYVEKIQKARTDLLKNGDTFAKAADAGKLAAFWEEVKVKAALKKIQKDTVKPITSVTSHAFSVLRSALALVEKTAKAYGPKKEEKEEK